jgi:hypothetical protein
VPDDSDAPIEGRLNQRRIAKGPPIARNRNPILKTHRAKEFDSFPWLMIQKLKGKNSKNHPAANGTPRIRV